jgi:hypothetical protein
VLPSKDAYIRLVKLQRRPKKETEVESAPYKAGRTKFSTRPKGLFSSLKDIDLSDPTSIF